MKTDKVFKQKTKVTYVTCNGIGIVNEIRKFNATEWEDLLDEAQKRERSKLKKELDELFIKLFYTK
jgi:hypothetical protein